MTTQLFIAVKNSLIAFKVCPHHSDEDQLVLKARHPEVGAIAAQVAGADILDTEQGSHYFLTFVNRKQFFEGAGALLREVFEGKVEVLPPKALQDTQAGPAIPVPSSLSDAQSELSDDEDDDSEF